MMMTQQSRYLLAIVTATTTTTERVSTVFRSKKSFKINNWVTVTVKSSSSRITYVPKLLKTTVMIVKKHTPLKIGMEQNHGGLEENLPFRMGDGCRFHVNLPGPLQKIYTNNQPVLVVYGRSLSLLTITN